MIPLYFLRMNSGKSTIVSSQTFGSGIFFDKNQPNILLLSYARHKFRLHSSNFNKLYTFQEVST